MSEMKRFFHITEGREPGRTAFAKAPSDIVRVVERMGFADAGLWQGWLGRLTLGVNRERLRKWIVGWRARLRIPAGSICLFQYPHFTLSDVAFADVLAAMRKRGVKVIGLLHDIEELRFGTAETLCLRDSTRRMFDQFDVIIVHNAAMRAWLVSQGYADERLVDLEIFDYWVPSADTANAVLGNQVVIAGNLDPTKAGYLSKLGQIDGVAWQLYGARFDPNQYSGGNITYHGAFSPDELPSKLAGSYGLVWDGTTIETCGGKIGGYLRYNNPHKLSLYLAAGLPVIVWEESAVANFVRRNEVGITVGSLKDLPKALLKIDGSSYERFVSNCCVLSEKLNKGSYVEKALRTAIQRLTRDF